MRLEHVGSRCWRRRVAEAAVGEAAACLILVTTLLTRRRAPHVHVVVRALHIGFLPVAARSTRLLADSSLLELGG